MSWVHEQVPDGRDFLELMLYADLPAPDKRGKFHHLCLEVADVDKAKSILESRVAKVNYTKTMEIQTGVNHKRQLNLYDPDGTRVELMEARTVGRNSRAFLHRAPAPSASPIGRPKISMRWRVRTSC